MYIAKVSCVIYDPGLLIYCHKNFRINRFPPQAQSSRPASVLIILFFLSLIPDIMQEIPVFRRIYYQ